MAEVRADVEVAVPADRVWQALTDWSRQGEWMIATRVAPVDGEAHEVGGRLRAVTGVRGHGVVDTMRITRWEPPLRCDVAHTGRIVRGSASFQVSDLGAGRSRVSWIESIEPPAGRAGQIGLGLIGPLVRVPILVSLRRFAANVAARPDGGNPLP